MPDCRNVILPLGIQLVEVWLNLRKIYAKNRNNYVKSKRKTSLQILVARFFLREICAKFKLKGIRFLTVVRGIVFIEMSCIRVSGFSSYLDDVFAFFNLVSDEGPTSDM